MCGGQRFSDCVYVKSFGRGTFDSVGSRFQNNDAEREWTAETVGWRSAECLLLIRRHSGLSSGSYHRPTGVQGSSGTTFRYPNGIEARELPEWESDDYD